MKKAISFVMRKGCHDNDFIMVSFFLYETKNQFMAGSSGKGISIPFPASIIVT